MHTLMGIIYESDHDYNNAFIAYRNAVDVYENEYKQLFQVDVPEQLKRDLVRTARLSGLDEEAMHFGRNSELLPLTRLRRAVVNWYSFGTMA